MDNTKLINKLRGKGFDELRDALKNTANKIEGLEEEK